MTEDYDLIDPDRDLKEALDALEDMVSQHCSTRKNDTVDHEYLSANKKACEVLVRQKILEETKEGYKWVKND